jgi:hypothetical protein
LSSTQIKRDMEVPLSPKIAECTLTIWWACWQSRQGGLDCRHP